jgi:hypothetical protein
MGRGGDDRPLALERPMPLRVASTDGLGATSPPTTLVSGRELMSALRSDVVLALWPVLLPPRGSWAPRK